MYKKFLLYITDDDIILYKGALEKLYVFKDKFEDAQHELKRFLSSDPKTSICLLLDRSHQDIREEQIPPLWPWDRIRLLLHKRAEVLAHGGYGGFQFLKEEGETYLRWAHIPPNDSLTQWLLWIQSLPNPFGGIFFIPLEARRFLKKNLPASKNYQMLLYNLSPQKIRHVIFKGNRLLLSRLSQGEEDLRTSLHFLSRLHPDIHEKLQILSLEKHVPLTFPQVTTLPDPQAFILFLASQKRPSLFIKLNASSTNLWLRRTMGMIFISALGWGGINIYQGFEFKNKSLALVPEIEALNGRTQELKSFLQNKNVETLRVALEHYTYFKSHTANPLKTIEQLSILLKKKEVVLENLKWLHEKELQIVLTFFMKDKEGSTLADQFESFLTSCAEVFPNSQIRVLTAPFNSSPHEVFKGSSNESLPLAQVRIILP